MQAPPIALNHVTKPIVALSPPISPFSSSGSNTGYTFL